MKIKVSLSTTLEAFDSFWSKFQILFETKTMSGVSERSEETESNGD